ncbi:MAG: GntR family transcriptional regulator [Spirochaetaceae bacterium]
MVLKYEKVILHIKIEVIKGNLKVGDPLPSINSVCKQFSTARETVVKAYKLLKDEGLIESKPGKGFFLIRETVDYKPSIFLMLNSFNPYMEVLYNSFKDELKDEYNLDVYFHHNNIDVFKSLISENRGKYQSFVIKPFLHPDVPGLLDILEDEYVMLLDRDEYISPKYSYICQDFSNGFYSGLESTIEKIKKYNSISYVYSNKNPHPQKTEQSFIQFSTDFNLTYSIINDLKPTDVVKNRSYIVLSDLELLTILKVSKSNNWVLGRDIGLISYNDNPINQFISGGLTAISTNFAQMGQEAANYAKKKSVIQKIIKPSLILRNSI